MMKFDMHCHTKAGSIDASVSVERYIELLSAQGFDGMLVTDHDSYKGYHKWMRKNGRSFWPIEQMEEQLEKKIEKKPFISYRRNSRQRKEANRKSFVCWPVSNMIPRTRVISS